ncbi:MAG: flagellar basal-body rod modification protein FlgD [Rhodobacteraceae bacterium HLUCCA12]|nr:MAG: flagellar basal-body rod modification protein FlgD [Rhodobacteraceae bacterium HLUCCA12]
MMQVNSLTAQAPAPAPLGSAPGQSEDYQTFLNMLTVQMRNQDPLNPMAPTDFAVQLATFSGVEQQIQTNELLSGLLGRTGMAEIGGWIGMEARIDSGAHFDGTPIDLAPDPAQGADRVHLIVRNANDAVVETVELPPGTTSFRWSGLDDDGAPLPSGHYRFELESRDGETVVDTSPVAAWLPVLEARAEDGMVALVLPGGMRVDSSTVGGLRRPPDDATTGQGLDALS